MKQLLSLILFVAGVASDLHARTVSGSVFDDATGEPLAGAMVQALNDNGRAVAFTAVKSDGGFSLSCPGQARTIKIRLMGYEELSQPIGEEPVAVRLKAKATVLRDVVVDAPDIIQRHDTLVFNVDKYASVQDKAIIDVIKRLPGVRVDKNGGITYNGEPINKLYVDGNDILGGQYGVATDNISPKDVKSVEIMENHQPIKALEDIEFSDQAGINLKLKEDARLRWAGVAMAGVGMPGLYDAQLFAMRIAPRYQNMVTLRSCNTGWNPATSIVEHGDMPMFSVTALPVWGEYVNADLISAPLPAMRTRDNLSGLANVITAWRKGATANTLKINYAADRLDYSTTAATRYFDPAIDDFYKSTALNTMAHDVNASWKAEINQKGYFMKNLFAVRGSWRRGRSGISGSEILEQTVRRRGLRLHDDLWLIRRTDMRILKFASSNDFFYSKDNLAVSRGESGQNQRLVSAEFRSVNEVSHGWIMRRWDITLAAGMDFDWRRLNTLLSGLTVPGVASGAHGDYYAMKTYVNPRAVYDSRGWRMTISLPAALHDYRQHCGTHHTFVTAIPALSVIRELGAKSDMRAALSYSVGGPSADGLVNCAVMSDFRNISILRDLHTGSHTVASSVAYRYRNPLTAMFFNARVHYTYSRSSGMWDCTFAGDYVITTLVKRLSDVHTAGATAGISKGFSHGRIVTGVDAGYSYSSAVSMRNGVESPYSQHYAEVKPFFKGTPAKWVAVDYLLIYGYNMLDMQGDVSGRYQSLSQSLKFTFIPTDCLQASVGAEQYFTRFSENSTAGMILVDASARWDISRRWQLELTATNLLDRRDYRYTSFGTLSQTDQSYRLRPRNLLLTATCRF